MELPYNTTISGDLLNGGGQFEDRRRATKRAGQEAFARSSAPAITSAAPPRSRIRQDEGRHRDRSGGRRPARPWRRVVRYINGVHVQNFDKWPGVSIGNWRRDSARPRVSPSDEALDSRVRLRRSAGRIAHRTSREYGVDVLALRQGSLGEDGIWEAKPIASPPGRLMRVDGLLPRFFLPEHAGIQYMILGTMS